MTTEQNIMNPITRVTSISSELHNKSGFKVHNYIRDQVHLNDQVTKVNRVTSLTRVKTRVDTLTLTHWLGQRAKNRC